jgi:hypothetical protein
MTEVHDLFPSFNAGELTPRLAARVDFEKFKSGLAELTNMIPLPEGGAMRRSGTRYISSTKTSTVRSRLKPFEFSTTQAYVLDFGEQNVQFYRNQGQVVSQNITASVANGTFTGNITSWSDISAGGGSITHDATNNRLNLVFSTTEGHAEQEITNSTAIEHIVRFRVFGSPGDSAQLQVGTATGLIDILSFKAEVGFHTIAFTATAANFFLQFKGGSGKTVQIDAVSLIDDGNVELTTPYTEAQLPRLEGPQSADVLYLFHLSHPTYKLERRGHTTWSLVEVNWLDGPYGDTNITATTLAASATTGKGITITASAITGINTNTGFQSTDVGRLVRLDNPLAGVDWGWARITAVASTTSVTADVGRDFGRTDADVNWRLGSWSATTGYPSVGSFFEQRMVVANTADLPQTFWMSQTANFEDFTPDSDPTTAGLFDGTVEDNDSFDFTISADDVNEIFWLSAGEDTLAIGTAGGEWVPSSTNSVLTPSDIAVRRQVTSKAARIQPVRVENVVLFVQRAGRKIKEFGFNFESDGFQSIDMTRLAQHITRPGVTEMVFAEETEAQVWVVRTDGGLASMTFRRKEDVVGWARHVIGGRYVGGESVTGTDISFTATDTISTVAGDFSKFVVGDELFISGTTSNDFSNIGIPTVLTIADDHLSMTVSGVTIVTEAAGASMTIQAYTDPFVESVTTIHGTNGAGQVKDSTDRDEVWIIVRRTINGATVRHIEMLERDFEDAGFGGGDDQEDAYYSDSLLTYDGAATTTITGLTHLEGETVKILADGATHADKVVASGQVTLDSSSKVVQVGLGYKHRMKFLRLTGGNPVGSSVGKIKRIDGITFVLLNSQTLRWGPSLDNMTEVDFRNVQDAMDAATPYFTGDFFQEFSGDWGTDPRIFVEHDDPTPFTLLAAAPEFKVNPVK